MSRGVESPTIRPGKDHMSDTIESHEAYGQISASRIHGNINLYGSDFTHSSFIQIRLTKSELHRSLNRDWAYEREQVAHVNLSEAQWATFVSSLNQGSGVQCTLDFVAHEGQKPALPAPIKRTEQFSDELRQKLSSTVEEIQKAQKDIADLGLPKGKMSQVNEALSRCLRELTANLPFVVEQFDRHSEQTVEKAKTEIHGYMTGMVQRAGLQALTGSTESADLPLLLERNDD